MAAPTFSVADTGVVITGTIKVIIGGAASFTAGRVFIVQVMQDGTGANATISADGLQRMENLAGTDAAYTSIGTFDVGSPAAAKQHLWIGRWLESGTIGLDVGITSSSGDDCYCRIYEFADVSTGTTLATVIENATAGTSVNGTGTSVTVADTGVTTLGVDRLALNLVGINDDLTGIAAFTGETGGDWLMPATFESSTGTDGTVSLMTAAMPAAGTINGGTDTITSDGWGVVGFALIGTTVASGFIDNEEVMALQAVNRSNVY